MDSIDVIIREGWVESYDEKRANLICPPSGTQRKSGEVCGACKMPWGCHSSVGDNYCPSGKTTFVPTGELVTDELMANPFLLLVAAVLG